MKNSAFFNGIAKGKGNKLKGLFVSIIVSLSVIASFSIYKNNTYDKSMSLASTWSDYGIRATSLNGKGTSSDPYLISNAEELGLFGYWVETYVSDKSSFAKLTSNINLARNDWKPIKEFKGTFDGNGMAIAGINITTVVDKRSGFFAYTNGATIKNTFFEGNITSIAEEIGGVAGSAYLTSVTKVTTSYEIKSSRQRSRVGGIFGKTESATISNSYNLSKISVSSASPAGGIVGDMLTSTITNTYNIGAITGKSTGYISGIGGIVGQIMNNNGGKSYLTNVYNTGVISGSGSNRTGGIFGWLRGQNLEIDNALNYGNISGESYVGGIGAYYAIASDDSGSLKIENSANTGNLSSTGLNVGGIMGNAYDIEIFNVSNSGNIKGVGRLGGIIGTHQSDARIGSKLNLSYAYNTGKVEATAKAFENTYIGGIVGFMGSTLDKANTTKKISYSMNKGDLSGYRFIGGIVGSLSGKSYKLDNVINEGRITAESGESGGIAGIVGSVIESKDNNNHEIRNAINKGSVTGKGTDLGGIIGSIQHNSYNKNSTTNTATIGIVKRTDTNVFVGAAIGRNVLNGPKHSNINYYSSSSHTVNNAFGTDKLIKKNNGTDSSGGKATAHSSTATTLSKVSVTSKVSAYSFSLTSIWTTNSQINGGYPILKDMYWGLRW